MSGFAGRECTPHFLFLLEKKMGEAPPVADEASPFRGSGTIGGPWRGPPIVSPRR